MLAICGASGSGKTTVVNELVTKYGLEKAITYTTRAPRKGEIDGIDYHFISDEQFKEKIKAGFFAEYTVRKTSEKERYYGSAKEDYENTDNKVIILDPVGIRFVRDNNVRNTRIILLKVRTPDLLTRLKLRGDRDAEIASRLNKDTVDFEGIDKYCDIIISIKESDTIEEVVKKVIKEADIVKL